MPIGEHFIEDITKGLFEAPKGQASAVFWFLDSVVVLCLASLVPYFTYVTIKTGYGQRPVDNLLDVSSDSEIAQLDGTDNTHSHHSEATLPVPAVVTPGTLASRLKQHKKVSRSKNIFDAPINRAYRNGRYVAPFLSTQKRFKARK